MDMCGKAESGSTGQQQMTELCAMLATKMDRGNVGFYNDTVYRLFYYNRKLLCVTEADLL